MRTIQNICILLLIFVSNQIRSQIITPPYSNDFEGLNVGWTASSISGSNWQLGLPSTPPLNTAHSGSNAWDVELNANYASNTECYLVSPEFNFSSIQNATLGFWQNRQTEIGWDGARVDFSVNNGQTWTVLGFYNDPLGVNWFNAGGLGSSGLSGWDGNSSGWLKCNYDLSLLNGIPSVRFRFAFNSDATTNLAGFSLDDFEVSTPFLYDARVKYLLEPNVFSVPASLSPVKVVVANEGLNYITTMDIGYSLNGIFQNSFSWNGLLAPGNMDTVVIDTLLVPSGTFLLCAYTDLPNDGNLFNDTLCETISNVPIGLTVGLNDSIGFINCIIPPVTDQFYISGTAPLLNSGDTVNIQLAFGDGADTSFFVLVNTNQFSATVSHTFLFAGQFSSRAIATAGVLSDTIIVYNLLVIATNCGQLSGNVFADLNANCIFDTTDFSLTNIPVRLMQGSTVLQTAYTDILGDYYFLVPNAVSYDIEMDTTYSGNNNYCPSSWRLTGITSPSTGNNFALHPDGSFDLEPDLVVGFVSTSAPVNIDVSMQNNFFVLVNGTLSLVYDTTRFDFVSAIPAVTAFSGDTLHWNVSGFSGYYSLNSFHANVTLNPKVSVTLGDTVCFSAFARPMVNDADPDNNNITSCQVVLNSAGPISKSVIPAGSGLGGNVPANTNSFRYTVTFINTGPGPANNVFIIDTIDSDLDISTLQVTGSSHLVYVTQIASSVVRFGLDNILLPDSNSNPSGSMGYITYKIAPKPGLPDGAMITNQAEVHFDFYPGIQTNLTMNTIDYTLGLTDNGGIERFIKVFPNPSGRFIYVSSNTNETGLIRIYDLFGNIRMEKKWNEKGMLLDLENLESGSYFINIVSLKYVIGKKLVVVK